MWRDNDLSKPDLSKPAPHHTARDRVELRSNRPRVTAGQRLAQALFDRAGPLARLVWKVISGRKAVAGDSTSLMLIDEQEKGTSC